MKQLILLTAFAISFLTVKAGCSCFPPDRFFLYGSYTFDSLSNTAFMNPGDTLDLGVWWACGGSSAGYEFFVNDTPAPRPGRIYRPGHYRGKSCCCDDNINYEWGFSFTVVYNPPLAVPRPGSMAPDARFIYMPAENNLLIRAWNLHQSTAALAIYDLQGREIYHSPLTFVRR